MAQVGSHNESRTGAIAAVAPSPLYLSESATGVYEFADAGPADAVLVLDTGVIQIDDDTAASGRLSTVLLGTTVYLTD